MYTEPISMNKLMVFEHIFHKEHVYEKDINSMFVEKKNVNKIEIFLRYDKVGNHMKDVEITKENLNFFNGDKKYEVEV